MAEESALLLPPTTKTVQGMHDDKMQVPKHSYNWKAMFRVKPNAAFLSDHESGKWFAEKLGLSDLLGYGVGCAVRAGIYSFIGVGAGIAGMLQSSCSGLFQSILIIVNIGNLLIFIP